MTIEAQYEDMLKMNQPPVHIVQDENFTTAFNLTMKAFAPTEKVRIVHYVRTKHYPWPLSSSVERPFSTDPKVIKYVKQKCINGEIENERMSFHNTFDYVYDSSRLVIHNIKNGKCFTGDLTKDHLYPIIAHFRPGLGKPGSSAIKNRLVWGVSKIFLIAECMFMYPLFDNYLRNGKTPLLWKYETALGGWTKLYNEIQPQIANTNATIITADWSEFDRRVPFELIEMVINASLEYYDLGHYAPDYLYHTESNCKYEIPRILDLFKWTIYATLSSPLLMPDGRVWMRTRNGVPSGMFRTQWLDSIINGIMITTILLDAGFKVTEKFILKVLGDDSLTVLFHFVPQAKHEDLKSFLAEKALLRFNAKLSLEKTEISNSLYGVELLGYRNRNGAAYRDHRKLLAQLLFPESEAPTYASLMGRCVGIAYADLGRSKLLYRVCKKIFERLSAAGYRPDSRQIHRYLSGSKFVETRMEIQINKFPSTLEIQKWSRTPYNRTKSDNDHYWPPEIFWPHFTGP
ncbi:RNA dependent RNA polymerase [Black grass cryptic virus 2]|nr:RNA dependent RNA polymerase [Black grass cryptic virus 2]CEK42600.1 RNA dependent RNA polymerase [Black grass cryptic virus 2]